jgi:UDP-glucose 4-epimerase
MKILVTGGSGFLGSHVADALNDAGHEVTIFDQIESPYLRDNQKMVVGDLMDEVRISHLTQGQDVVYHFAGIADIDVCAKRPTDTARINILGTVQLLEACRKAKVKRFVFASSAYVFSDAGYFYRSSKRSCESFIEDYANLYGLKYTCLRYGSLYGERADDHNSIYRMIKQAIKEGKITYHGEGDEMREFIHVRDAAQSSVYILRPEFENQNIILTGSEKLSYENLLAMIKEIMGNGIEIEKIPSTRKAHYNMTPYNFSPKLGKKLVNNPHIDMGQGLLLSMAEIYENLQLKHEEMGLILNGTPRKVYKEAC